jgi:hypothetical protein
VLIALLLPNACSSEPYGPSFPRTLQALPCFVDHRFGLRFAISLGGLFVASVIAVMAIRGLRIGAGGRDSRHSADGPSWWYARGILLLLLGATLVFTVLGGCAQWSWFGCGHLPFVTVIRGLVVSLAALAIVLLAMVPARWPISRTDGSIRRASSFVSRLAFAMFAAGVVLALALPGGCGPSGPIMECVVVPRIGLRIGTMFVVATVAVWLTALGAHLQRGRTGRSSV